MLLTDHSDLRGNFPEAGETQGSKRRPSRLQQTQSKA